MFQKLKIREALSSLAQDLEKDGIKALLRFMAGVVWNAYGVPFVVFIVSFLVGVSYWLKIPITMPVSLVVMFFVFVLVILLRLRKLEANRRVRKPKNIVVNGLLYESTTDGTITGPFCARCNAKMIMLFDQDENVTRVVFGKDAIYKYSCTCGHEVVSSRPSGELLKQAQEYFQINKSEQ